MIVSPDSNDLARLSPTDARNANLITLLLLCAKTLQVCVPGCAPNADRAKADQAGKQLADFVFQLSFMHGDGRSLEADTLALAKELGFNIQQHYMSKVAHA